MGGEEDIDIYDKGPKSFVFQRQELFLSASSWVNIQNKHTHILHKNPWFVKHTTAKPL